MLSGIARKLRLQFEGAIYHVMNRGDHQEAIFRGVKDQELFLKTLGEACEKTDWQVHAWCLMSNHFHLVVETPKANLAAGMKSLLGPLGSRSALARKLLPAASSAMYPSPADLPRKYAGFPLPCAHAFGPFSGSSRVSRAS